MSPPVTLSPSDELRRCEQLSVEGFQRAIQATHGSRSRPIARERVDDHFEGELASGQGDVLDFEPLDHPEASRVLHLAGGPAGSGRLSTSRVSARLRGPCGRRSRRTKYGARPWKVSLDSECTARCLKKRGSSWARDTPAGTASFDWGDCYGRCEEDPGAPPSAPSCPLSMLRWLPPDANLHVIVVVI